MPRVLNKRDGYISMVLPNTIVYIGRPSIWGNPYVIGSDGSRDDVVKKFEVWLMARPDLVERAKKELRGRDLVCWCAPLRCHGEVLLRIANA